MVRCMVRTVCIVWERAVSPVRPNEPFMGVGVAVVASMGGNTTLTIAQCLSYRDYTNIYMEHIYMPTFCTYTRLLTRNPASKRPPWQRDGSHTYPDKAICSSVLSKGD